MAAGKAEFLGGMLGAGASAGGAGGAGKVLPHDEAAFARMAM